MQHSTCTSLNGNRSSDTTPMVIRPTAKSFPGTVKRCYLTVSIVCLILTTAILLFYSEPELLEAERQLTSRLGELYMKEQYLSLRCRALEEETNAFLSQLKFALRSSQNNSSAEKKLQLILQNITETYLQSKYTLQAPTIFNFLPYLKSNYSALQPFYRLSRNRTGVSTILGIPTVKRPAQSYLLSTLNDLIFKMSPQEKADSLIVVLIAETNEEYVFQIADEIKNQFTKEIESGLIDIISPPPSYYPDFEKLPLTLSDPLERVRWRSKQSLDFAFLMMYSYSKGIFYIQLEDDILAKNNYLSIMKTVALSKITSRQQWFVLDFCQLGFIGKMFRCSDLPWIIQFFLMFFNDKPVDWLLDGLIQTKACHLEKDNKDCKKQKDRLWVHSKPSLFQHIGTTSSLKGKIQKLKDRHFGRIPLFFPHHNPPARALTSVRAYKRHTLKRAYNGETFFWGLMPHADDWISFQFEKPIKIKNFKFGSGNAEYPSDKLYNTSVLISVVPSANSVSIPFSKSNYRYHSDNSFLTVGSFNTFGVAENHLGAIVGAIKEIRLVIHDDSRNWVILSEIFIEEEL